MTIRERIKDCIDEKGLKHTYVAEKIGLTPSNFSSILAGRRNMSAEQLSALCDVLKVPATRFIQPLTDPELEP